MRVAPSSSTTRLHGRRAGEPVERRTTKGTNLSWTDEAACRGQTDLMYNPDRIEEARRLCHTCPVSTQCDARADGELGMWAGKWRIQRNRIYVYNCMLATCEKEFVTTGADRLFCSNECRLVAQRKHAQLRVDEYRWRGRAHGIRATYNAGCRCDACTTAERIYRRGRRAKVSA